MKEYNSQDGMREKHFEMMNPRYYIYKEQEDKHAKHLEIIQDYQKNIYDQDSCIVDIIQDIKKNIAYAQEKRKENAIFEEDIMKSKPKYDHSMTEIQQKCVKRYQVPLQYRHIFGIVINKLNNFYQTKKGLFKEADKINYQLLEDFTNSKRTNKDFMHYSKNYITNKQVDEIFVQNR